MLATLRKITEDIEEAAGFSSEANADADGYWLRIARAMESAAGITTAANNNRQGYMLRAAIAAEAASSTTGAEENMIRAGYLKRIADAFEANGDQAGGSDLNRIAANARSFCFALGYDLALAFDQSRYRSGEDHSADVAALPGYSKAGANAITSEGYEVTAAPSQLVVSTALPSGDFYILLAGSYANTAAIAGTDTMAEVSNGSFDNRINLIRFDDGGVNFYINHAGADGFISVAVMPGAGELAAVLAYRSGVWTSFAKVDAAAAALAATNNTLTVPVGTTVATVSTQFDGNSNHIGTIRKVMMRQGTFTNAEILALLEAA